MLKDTNIKISVIIPVYNSERYLNKCVESVLTQSYKNIECILIDDESSDLSPKICDFYKNKDSRVIVIHQKNSGQGGARNRGIDIATGDYIMFIDNDDMLPSDEVLNEMIQAIGDNDILIAKEKLFDRGVSLSILNARAKKLSHTGGGYLCAMLHLNMYTGTVWSKLYKKTLFTSHNILFQGNLICEDEDIIPRLYYETEKFAFLEKKCYERYRNPESQTNKMDEKTFMRKAHDRIVVSIQLKKYFQDKPLTRMQKKILCKHILGLYLQGVYFIKCLRSMDNIESMCAFVQETYDILLCGVKYMFLKYYFVAILFKVIGVKRTINFI